MSLSLLQQAARRLGARALYDQLSPAQRERLRYAWPVLARPEQLEPEGDWSKWLVLAGRGWGKTRTMAQWCIEQARNIPRSRGALVARTAADVRDVMVEGESGILAVSPPEFRPIYEPSKRRLTWPNGSQATTYSADKGDQLRGPQHHFAACDELASWGGGFDAWDQLLFGLRLGTRPRALVTTTPRPVRVIRGLLADPDCHVTRGTTYDNRANLPESFFRQLVGKYEGSRLGRQELLAEVLDDVPGSLWQRAWFDRDRVHEAPDLVRIVVAVDPAVTSGEDSDMTGIVVAGLGADGHGYVLDDLTCRESPDTWARRAVGAFHHWKADRLVAEVNQGGDLVKSVLAKVDPMVPTKLIHASRGKRVRAEPIAALYEQGRVHHVGGFPDLEDQACVYVPDASDFSPDRVDALVYAIGELMPYAEVKSEVQRITDDPMEQRLLEREARAHNDEWVPE